MNHNHHPHTIRLFIFVMFHHFFEMKKNKQINDEPILNWKLKMEAVMINIYK
jgi:hypothetical protein